MTVVLSPHAEAVHASFEDSLTLLVGRKSALEDFAEALEDGPCSSDRAPLYTEARGPGKPVMLNAVEELARQQGWLVISETRRASLNA